MRELAEVRVTPMRIEITIRATRYQNILVCGVPTRSMIYLDGDIQVHVRQHRPPLRLAGRLLPRRDIWTASVRRRGPTPRSTRSGTASSAPIRSMYWPTELGPRPALYFNAGMFVYEPSLSVYDDLLTTLKITTPPTPFAEQDFWNMFFRDIYVPIPPIYNLVLAMMWRHPENIELDKVKVVHYCAAGSKWWRYTGKEEHMDWEDIKMLVKKWRDIYNDESLDYNAAIDGETDKFVAVLLGAGVAHFVTAASAA